MGGVCSEIDAETKTELKKLVQRWAKSMRDVDWDIRLGWDTTRVVKTDYGYKIKVWAHS